ncbi:MAG: hypothetical protein AAGE83_13590, partial [Pseudomonadota bacterium]
PRWRAMMVRAKPSNSVSLSFIVRAMDPGEIKSLETMARTMKLTDTEFDGFARTIIALQRGPSAQQD